MKTTRLIRAIARKLSGAMLVTLLLAPLAVASQIVVSPNANDVFNQIGFDSSGTAWILGTRNDQATLFQFTGSGFNATTLNGLFPGGDFVVNGMSRDAQYLVGASLNNSTFEQQATLWNRSALSSPIGLSYVSGYPGYASGNSVASTAGGPVSVGTFGTGVIWNNSGAHVAPQTSSGIGTTTIDGISSDGLTWIGSKFGVNGSPIIGNMTSATSLPTPGNSAGVATEISPNAHFVGGMLGDFINPGQAALWEDGSLRLLTLDGSPILGPVQGVSDSGFAVGTFNGDGWIYDPRTGLTSLFDSWYASENGSPVPHHVRGINDIFEHDGNLFFAAEGSAIFGYSSVPEPTTWALITTGSLLFFALRRRKKRI